MGTNTRTGTDRVLGAAVLTMGLLAGFFWSWADSVMPGLAGVDDRTFIEAMQSMIRSTERPVFYLVLFGAPALTIWALVGTLRIGSRRAAGWIAAALALYGVCFVLTAVVHVPLNNQLQNAGDPVAIADLRRVVEEFEGPWVAWHVVRTAALVGSFAALVAAVLADSHGRPRYRSRPARVGSRE